MATRGQQRRSDGTHIPLMAGLKGSLVFCPEMQQQAYISFSPDDVTGKRPHCFLHCPLPPFRRFHHSILPQHCSLSENRILPNAFGSLPGNGHFSPLTNPEIQDSMAMQRCKVWRALRMNYHCIPRLEPFSPDQKDKCVLSPSPQDMCLLLTNSRLFRLQVLSLGPTGSDTCCR